MTTSSEQTRKPLTINSFLAGLILGSILSSVVVITVAQLIAESDLEWETLAAAALASCAAAITIWQIRRQIRQADDHKKEDVKRKLASARSVLPLALSGLCEYAEKSNNHAFYSMNILEAGGEVDVEPPSLPGDIIALLRDFVEHAGADVSTAMSNLISYIQVHDTRLRTLPRKPVEPAPAGSVARVGNIDCPQMMADSAILYGWATCFFSYARRDTDVVPEFPTEEMASLLFRLRFFEENDFPNVYSFLRSKLESQGSKFRPAVKS